MVLEAREKLLTVKETAKVLKVTTGRVRQLLISQRLRGYKVGRDWLIPESEIKRYQEKKTETLDN